MKIFKRPMFRKGGEAMTGIMETLHLDKTMQSKETFMMRLKK